MIIRKIDEYRSRYINNTETTVGIYEFPGTEKERRISLKPRDEVIIKIKEREIKETKEIKIFDKKKGHPINTMDSNK